MLKFYHAPWSRSSGVLWLLEELGVSYRIEPVDIRGSIPESYRDIQPNKKVPAVDIDGTIVTERAAICLYLSERFTEAGLAPSPDDPSRAAFLSALVYADSVFDPAVAARAQGWNYTPANFSFGSFDDMVRHLERLRARCFRKHRAGVGLHQRGDAAAERRVEVGCRDPEAAKHGVAELAGRGVAVVGHENMIAGPQHRHKRGRDRGESGRQQRHAGARRAVE